MTNVLTYVSQRERVGAGKENKGRHLCGVDSLPQRSRPVDTLKEGTCQDNAADSNKSC